MVVVVLEAEADLDPVSGDDFLCSWVTEALRFSSLTAATGAAAAVPSLEIEPSLLAEQLELCLYLSDSFLLWSSSGSL